MNSLYGKPPVLPGARTRVTYAVTRRSRIAHRHPPNQRRKFREIWKRRARRGSTAASPLRPAHLLTGVSECPWNGIPRARPGVPGDSSGSIVYGRISVARRDANAALYLRAARDRLEFYYSTARGRSPFSATAATPCTGIYLASPEKSPSSRCIIADGGRPTEKN